MRDYQQFTPQVKIVKPKFIAAMRFQEREYHGSMPAGRQGGWTSGGFAVQGYRLQDCVYLFIWLDMPGDKTNIPFDERQNLHYDPAYDKFNGRLKISDYLL